MVVEAGRFLADTLRARLHDADRERPACRLGELGPEHRRWYEAIEDALAEARYEACPACLGTVRLLEGVTVRPSRSS